MPSEKPKIGVIILAAGNSSRMNGESKQLLEFEGKTLIRRASETAVATNFQPIVIVSGENAEKLQAEVKNLPVLFASNENWKIGISSSIKTGISVLSDEQVDAALIMLCDQPFVSVEVLLDLTEAFSREKKLIAACKYQETIGVPAIFSREVFDELLNLREDEGAKKIIKKYVDKAALIDAPEAAFDVDTISDYENLKQFPGSDLLP
jgi:molybdenum cofactor cytidylyltransferase